jgi:hypothetical protein
MKGDFSRKTFDPAKHYSGVLMQQGRVQLDADWNEQLAVQRHRDYTEAEDVIGECGAPKHDAGFLVQPTPDGTDLVLSPGRFYVHGRLCELESTPVDAVFVSATEATVGRWHVDGADFAPNQWVELTASNVAAAVVRVQATTPASRRLTFASTIAAFQNAAAFEVRRLTTYLTQPDLPNPPFSSQPNPALPPVLALPSGAFLVYVDVWPRHLTALDDDLIREKALGGPDTATRVKTVWQVKLWPGPDADGGLPGDTGCGSPVAAWDAATAPSTGRLAARTKPAPDSDNPCLIPPEAGYLGLENQLYRVEIHDGGALGTDPITFKWSRDNGSVVKSIERIAGTTDFTVHDTGPDDVLGLANGQWVEQVDDVVELHGVARDLFQFAKDPVTGAVTLAFPVDEARHPQLRRWDSTDEVAVPSPPVGGGWIDLENGVQVRFEPGTYRTGDYWQIPARTVLGDVEWPRDGAGQPVSLLRRGIRHHYCRIAVLHLENERLTVEDCRPVFPPLTELKATSSCCTFTVGDGRVHAGDFTLIQEAVDHLPPGGGQICIFPGTYVENVRVEGRTNVHIKGCGHRTRVVSAPPSPNGVAAAVFHLVSCERVKIEALGVEAADAAPGILADGERPNRRVTIERVGVAAARDSAIKFRGGQDVMIESCRITMKDPNGGWPGIFLQADDALVRDNVVDGTLAGLAPGRLFRLAGAAAVSGLQVGGGSERVRVHGNLFRGCSGQGITLGSVAVVGADGEPVRPGLGWVVDETDPCFPCDDPTTGDRPPREGDGPPARLQSEGDLYDVDIRRNRIFDVGLDGIGTAHFFDLQVRQKARGFVRVSDLAIVDNRIERSVRRGFAPIPASMVDLMAYGGISLSWVEGLVVRDNRIEDVGWSGLLPVCGIFVLAVEGLEAARNDILNSGRAASASPTTALPGRRGGIHVVYAAPLLAPAAPPAPDPDAPAAAAVALPQQGRRLGVAAIVEENTVDVIQGQALSLGALGPVSVVSNRFASRGLAPRDLVGIVRGQTTGLANALTHLSSLVSIVNLGATGGALNYSSAVSRGATLDVAAARGIAGTVLFDDNVCSLALDAGAAAEGQGPRLPPAVLIMSLDDVGFQDNQCDHLVPSGTMTLANAVFGISLRAVSNRFKETPGRALYSAWTFGLVNMTAHNQANHCLLVTGTLQAQDQPNHVLNAANCPRARQELAVQVRPLVDQ